MFNGAGRLEYVDVTKTLKLYDQEELFQKYTGIRPDLTKRYTSILRLGDRRPDCRFKWHSGLLYFVDNAGVNGRLYFNIVDVLCHLYHITLLQAIHNVINENDTSGLSYRELYESTREQIQIRFKYRPWPEDNYFALSPVDLMNEHVYLVTEYWIKAGGEWKYNSLHNPKDTLCVAYYFPNSDHTKLYFPYKQQFRWYTNCDSEDVYGRIKLDYYLEKDNRLIIITKSQKDRLTLDYDCGIPAIAPQSENHNLPSRVIGKVKQFRKAVILYDPDATGQRFAAMLSENTGIPWTNIDLAKDVFEFKSIHGVNNLKKYMQCLNQTTL